MRLLSLFVFVVFGALNLTAQDDYHSDLIAYLFENYGIENPEFIISDNEVANINSMGLYGSSSIQVSDASGLNFTKVTTINVPTAGGNQWDSGYKVENNRAIAKDDIVLISFWAKRNSESAELFLFAENSSNFDKEFYFPFYLTPDWTQYFMAFSSSRDFGNSQLSMGLHLASQAQNFDIAGFTVLNYGTNYDLEEVPSSFTNGDYQGSDPDAEWRDLAATRIENIRKADLNIVVVNENGNAIPDAEVKLEMVEHEFGFGSAFVTCRFPGNDCYNATYVDKVLNLDGEGHAFNVGVTENAVKWDAWEEEWIGSPTETVNAIKWLHDNDVTMRGHTLIWPGFNNMPDDIAQNSDDLDYLRERIMSRIETMVDHPVLKDIIREWDVLNEITVNRDLENAFKSDPNFITGREIYQEIFAKVKELDPDLLVYMNDYVVLSGGGSSQTVIGRYKTFLNEIQESDQPFDGIGFQCHIGSTPTSILKLESVLDEFYQRYQKPMKITEYDLNDLVNDETAGKYMADFLTMTFSHPGVNAFIMWGFWDGNHWKGNAPMFDINWNLKPSGQAFIDKVFNEWWSNETSQTGDDGIASFRPFKGKHKITATKDGVSRTSEVIVSDGGTIQLLLEGVSNVNNLNDSDFVLSPNPVTQNLFMISYPESLGSVNVDIYSTDGRLVQQLYNVLPNRTIDIELNAGLYYLKIQNDEGRVMKRMVVK